MAHTGFKLNCKALFGLMVLAAAGAMPVQAATFTVPERAADGVANDAACSLREAVMQINAGENSADCFSTDPFGINDTINLGPGTHNLTKIGLDEDWDVSGSAETPFVPTNTPDASKGDIDILKSVRIVGTSGAALTTIQWHADVAAADRDRIFHVYTDAVPANQAPPIEVAIEGVTIKGGRTDEEFIAFADPLLTDRLTDSAYWLRRAGGGIAVGFGAGVVLIDPDLEGDENSEGRGGSQQPPASGVPTYEYKLTLVGVNVLGNYAEGDGAGVFAGYPMNATNVVISGNTSTVNGGGLYNEGESSLVNSTVSDNVAEGGGGMFLTGEKPVTIKGTTFSGNRAIGGGAISGRAGVAINMVNSTISGNLGSDVGAGLYHQGAASLRFVTIANNIAGADAPTAGSGINVFPSGAVDVTLKNVLLAANKVGWDSTLEPDGPDDPGALASANCGYTGNIPAAVASNGYNLSTDDSCTTFNVALNDIVTNADPATIIGPLADNNVGTTGTTLTHALLAGSPALSAGGVEGDVTTDQRGAPRENPPDIGAFELDNINEGGGGGGGCAVGGEGRLDPTLPAMLAAALVFFGLRRRAGK